MPLQKKNEIKKLTLPTSKDLPEAEKEWIVCEVGPLSGGDVIQMDNFRDYNDFMLNVLTRRIVEWNVKDGDAIAKLTIDNVRQLPVDDMKFLIGELLEGQEGGAEATDPKAPAVTAIPPSV